MTILVETPVVARPREHPVPWRAMIRVTWLQRRSTLIGLFVLFVACAIAIVIGEAGTRALYGSYVANGCITNPDAGRCQAFAIALNIDPFSAMVIVCHVLPILMGVFVGAPLLSRELESGTFRFTWTQGIGRVRFVFTSLVLLAVAVTTAGFVLGLLLNWYAHPFEVIRVDSQWQSGMFATTGPMLAAWTLFALCLGTFLGAAIGRTVAAMAATMVGVGGLLIGSFVWLVDRLDAIGAIAMTGLAPIGLGVGSLNTAFGYNAPTGSWLVRGWFTGPDGHRLSAAASNNVIGRMYDGPANSKVDPSRWLSAHHFAYWVSYQPASRFWIFQLLAAAILIGLAALLGFLTVRIVRHRS